MRIATFVSISALALVLIIGPAGAIAQSPAPADAPTAPEALAAPQLATLGTLDDAVPMASDDLKRVKGQHFHVVFPGTGFFLINEYLESLGAASPGLNGPDQSDFGSVPSYSGLCKAAWGPSPIIIPGQIAVDNGGGC